MRKAILYYHERIKTIYIRSYYLKKFGLYKTIQRFDWLGGKKLMSSDETHDEISRMLLSGKPCMIARFGSIELQNFIEEKLKIERKKENRHAVLCKNAGFFPNVDHEFQRFSNCMEEAVKSVDIQGVWWLPYEGWTIKKLFPQNSKIAEARYLEPWFCPQSPWTRALQGKKVLVIHPMVDTIEKQYINRKEIFAGHEDYLPYFELLTLKAVQTQADATDERFGNWFEALDYMHRETQKLDFDIAIIGCGAYGYPLASMIKKDGKQALHLGGVVQAMFGIKGKRWEEDSLSVVHDLYNEFWVRPEIKEIPKGAEKIEGACYW